MGSISTYIPPILGAVFVPRAQGLDRIGVMKRERDPLMFEQLDLV
jgi:hypothetical protein